LTNDVVLFLHLLGLMMGAAGGLASAIIMRRALTLPADQAGVLRSLGPTLARFSHIGLALMWLTGVALVILKYGGFGSLPTLFWIKMLFVLSLTLAAITIEWTYAEIKRGNAVVAARLPRLGPWAGLSSLLAVLAAVLTFH
jgi:hypothetical protein